MTLQTGHLPCAFCPQGKLVAPWENNTAPVA